MNIRGTLLNELTASLDLRLLNVGDVPTCVRRQGESVVDTSWSTAGFRSRVMFWCVLDLEETLSDHCYISFQVRRRRMQEDSTYNFLIGPHWRRHDFNMELYQETATWLFNGLGNDVIPTSVDVMADTLRQKLTAACDVAGRRGRKRTSRGVPWWSLEVAAAHDICVRGRRLYLRVRHRIRGPELHLLSLIYWSPINRQKGNSAKLFVVVNKLFGRSCWQSWTMIHGALRIRG